MKLVDVMGAAGLSMYAIVAPLLFVLASPAIVVRTFPPGSTARYNSNARLPFTHNEPSPAERGRE